MTRKKRMPTLWELPDELWEKIRRILEAEDPPKHTGRKRVDLRKVMDAIIFRFRTGCQWNQIPRVYGDDSTIHRHFQRWRALGVFEKIWAVLVEECEELGKVDWRWQAVDDSMGKARMGGDKIGPNPTDRAKNGVKKSVMTDGGGGPISVVVAGANVHDTKLLEETINSIVVDRPEPTDSQPQHLCLDRGYDNPTGKTAVENHGYIGHIPKENSSRQATKKRRGHRARRWVVERTLAWLSKCRGILIRYEKKAENYLAMIQFACALLLYRRLAYSSF